jgi:hypothetical protein
MAKKYYRLPGKTPDLGTRKIQEQPADKVEKKKLDSKYSIKNLNVNEIDKLSVVARTKAKVAYLNKVLRKKEPSLIAQIIHYWVKST